MHNPFHNLSKRDYILWVTSLCIIFMANILPGHFDILTLIAATVGVTSLIFAAKGNVWSQVLMIIFSILYGIISYRFHYWGEMITYLGMTMPMAVWSFVTWMKNPSEGNAREVKIQHLNGRHWFWLLVSNLFVTGGFYFLLKYFSTPNLGLSTLSVTTSFLAASLTMLRSSYFALSYAANDVVLIILWILASLENPVYIPVIFNFGMFLINDFYGFLNWKKREKTA